NEAAVVVQTSSDLTPSPTLGHSNWLPRSGPKPTQWRKAMKAACPVLSRRPRRDAEHQITPGPSVSMAGGSKWERAYRWSVIGRGHVGGKREANSANGLDRGRGCRGGHGVFGGRERPRPRVAAQPGAGPGDAQQLSHRTGRSHPAPPDDAVHAPAA